MIQVSVVLPNHNHARELETSLELLVSQTRAPDEIIVIDDASTDDSIGVIGRYAHRHPNLRLLRNDTRLGVAASVRRGIEAATSPYIILASADERMARHACEALSAAMVAFPQARLGVSLYTEWCPESDTVRVHGPTSQLGMWYLKGDKPAYIPPAELRSLLRRDYVCLSVNTAIFERAALLEVGGFDPALRWHSDWFAIYAIALRHGFCAIPSSLVWFRKDPGSYSAVGMRDRRAQRQVAMAIQRKLRQPAFRDVERAVLDAPVVMSTFLRPTLLALAASPRDYPRLTRLAIWWAGQVAKGRRPAAWARLLGRLRPNGCVRR